MTDLTPVEASPEAPGDSVVLLRRQHHRARFGLGSKRLQQKSLTQSIGTGRASISGRVQLSQRATGRAGALTVTQPQPLFEFGRSSERRLTELFVVLN